jgi:hypothetical protein
VEAGTARATAAEAASAGSAGTAVAMAAPGKQRLCQRRR